MAERYLSMPLTVAFQERATAELSTLKSRLNDNLKQDINRIYTDCLFTDLDLLFTSGCIRTHRSLLQTRVPNFYKELIKREQKRDFTSWNKLNIHLIETFIREVYNRNVLQPKEDAIVAQIHILRGEKECDIGSPESDIFVTPKASPSDCRFTGPLESNSHRNYYSLVHLDEENHHQSLERELAEQDELSKSFKSILIKEKQQKPHKVVKSTFLAQKDESSRAQRPSQFNSKLKPQAYQYPKRVLKSRSDSDELSSKYHFSREEEIMSNPDSFLEPVSSGYVTGCSPRDTNGSEALGADTTEIVTSEDMPHDDKSRGTSSVSSDPGTWDSTFPTNDDDTCIERENPENVIMSDSIVFFNGTDPSSIHNNPEEAAAQKPFPEYHIENRHDEYLCSLTESKDSFINIKMETKLLAPVNNHDFDTSGSVTNNFFIDASSLRDENEMYLPSLQNQVFHSTNDEPKSLICDYVSQKSVIEKSDLDLSKLDNILENEHNRDSDLEKSGSVFPENRKLIRRNTFDLDPEDTTLNKLKEEYEKSQQSFDKSLTVDSLNKINDDLGKNSQEVSSDICNVPDILKYNVITKEEDIHSPDSLNNDFHIDSYSNPNIKKIVYPNEEIVSSNQNFRCEMIEEVSELKEPNSTNENEPSIHQNFLEENGVTSFLNGSVNYEKNPPNVYSNCEFPDSRDTLSSVIKEDKIIPKLEDSYFKDGYFSKFECTPIVSGGSQISAVPTSEYSVSASPLTRRKTEFAPILSGGFDDLPSPEITKPKPKGASSLSTSWVVDMSNSCKSPPESLSDNKSEKSRVNNSAMGFFIPLDDPYPSFDSCTSNSSVDSGQVKRSNTLSERNSCGFFIDLKGSKPIEKKSKTEVPYQEKKLFSMFIDIGNSDSTSPKSKPGSPFFPNKRNRPSITERLTTKQLDKKSNSNSSDSGLDLVEHPEIAKGRLLFNENFDHSQTLSDSSNNDSGIATKRQSFFMFIGNEESPVTRRKTMPHNIKQNTNRHSWNNDYKHSCKSETFEPRNEHKRSSSVSYDQTFIEHKYMSDLISMEETALKQKEKKSTSMLSSWHGPIKPTSELSRIISNGAKSEFKEKSIDNNRSLENSGLELKSEEMSCSVKSDEVFDNSNATLSSKDEANRTFVVDDVSKAVNVNTNDLELSTPSHDIASDLSKDESVTDPVQEPKSTSSNITNKSSTCDADTPKQTELSNSQQALDLSSSGFVKLSDMDKEPVMQTWKSSSKNTRMSRSIPEASFIENKILTNSASSRSLSRLFPHLYSKTDSKEASLQSSIQSSVFEPSPLEASTEEEEGSCGSSGPCSRLGEDLLRMFLDEISPDVTVEVGGRRIKAHKCILSSRCQYFAGMLSGGWVESAGNVISLQGFSYNTVHFALCHIYSGASQIPDTISIVELATLADMLCLEGLKEVIMYTLKVKYCHFFHKPCSGCLVGVVECLPLAAAYSLDEIYRKSLRWITKHFVKVWPTKGFASLPKELHDKCFKQHIVHMSVDNVLETVMGCDKLEATIPNVRWANPVLSLNSKLHESTVKYLGQHFSSVLASHSFMHLGQEDCWTVTRLEETLLNVSKSLSPDQACQSYKRIKIILTNINKIDPEEIDWKLEFLELLTRLETSIEDCLIRQAGRAARTTSWAKLDLSLRRKIQEAACLVFTPGPRPASASREMKGCKTNETKPKSPAPVPASTRRNTTPANHPAKTVQSPIPKPKMPKNLSHVKSRYLEPKPTRPESGEIKNGGAPRRLSGGGGGKGISSSDSSRTSSPATGRVSRPGTAERRTPVASRRVADLSSPSPNSREQRASSSKEPEVKGAMLKRQSTFRVATKASSAKQVLPATRQTSRTRPQSSLPIKTNSNVNKAKQGCAVRSGTFLRDDSSHLIKKNQQSN